MSTEAKHRASLHSTTLQPTDSLMAEPLPIDATLAVETDGSFPGLLSAYGAVWQRGALPATVGRTGRGGPPRCSARPSAL